MSLLDGFDDAFRGLTEADVHDLPEPEPESEPEPAPAPVVSRHLDPAAVAVANRLLGVTPPAASAVAAPLVELVETSGTRAATLDRELIVGRADTCDVIVALDVVSRRHCAVADGAVRDLGSANGTVVIRGHTVIPVGPEPVALEPGDVLATNRGRAPLAHVAEASQ